MTTHGWGTSDRRERLPPDWAQIRSRVLARDKWCRGCGLNLSVEVDHVIRNDDHSMENLVGLCRGCHRKKTQAESAAARRAISDAGRYPHERHPGAL